MNVTKRLENAAKALQENQLKKALYLTEHKKTDRQHQWVEEAARKCLANKEDRKSCELAIKEAKDKILETITPPMEDSSLEGLEDYLSDKKPISVEPDKTSQMTDEELYRMCPECHIAVAASVFADICKDYPEIQACKPISEKLADETTEPVDWIKAMIKTAEQTEGEPKKQMVAALSELTAYLKNRDSPWLKELDKEVQNGETTAIPTRAKESP